MAGNQRTHAKAAGIDPADLKDARQVRMPATFSPMLATLVDEPFSRPGWIFEPKLDGIRAVALIRQGKITLLSRRGLNMTAQFPNTVAGLERYMDLALILDGEIVALDSQGHPSFQLLQQRIGLTGTSDINRAELKYPVIYYVFDITYFDGFSLLKVPLAQRKETLAGIVVPSRVVQTVEYFQGDGVKIYEASVANGLEGVVAKRLDSVYEPGKRSRAWLKVKGTTSEEYLIAGYTTGTGARNSTFGSLVLGYYDDREELQYAGRVGTGFNERLLKDLVDRMRPLKTKVKPFSTKVPIAASIQWLRPELVAEIKFAGITNEGRLRAPVFLRLRSDKAPQDVRRAPLLSTEEV